MNKPFAQTNILTVLGIFLLFVTVNFLAGCCQVNSDNQSCDTPVADKSSESSDCASCPSAISGECTDSNAQALKPATSGEVLPKMIDYGSGTCVPCKMMTPILEELKTEYAGTIEVSYIDVKENNAAAQAAKIRVIPTQIFIDANGKEMFRHEGFFAKEQIVAKFTEFNFTSN